MTMVVLLAVTGGLFLLSKRCATPLNRRFAGAMPPEHMQTFEDFVAWQTDVRFCRQVQVRGVTYYHVIGPEARRAASGGALYVFDANGNYVGWSQDSGDVMRNEAIFYPEWWMPEKATVAELSYSDLKQRLSAREWQKQDLERAAPADAKTRR